MRDQRISFETARLAREKHFEEECDWLYREDQTEHQIGNYNYIDDDSYISYSAPTQTELQRWLREQHDIIVVPTIFDKGFLEDDKFCYQFVIYNKIDTDEETLVSSSEWKTWEEALEEGLKGGLGLIK